MWYPFWCSHLNQCLQLLLGYTVVLLEEFCFIIGNSGFLTAFFWLFQSTKHKTSCDQIAHYHKENGYHCFPLHDCLQTLWGGFHSGNHSCPRRRNRESWCWLGYISLIGHRHTTWRNSCRHNHWNRKQNCCVKSVYGILAFSVAALHWITIMV